MVSQVNVNSQEASIPYPCQQHEVVVQPDSLDDSDSRDEAQRDEDGGHDEDGDGDHQDGGSAILHLQRQRGDNRRALGTGFRLVECLLRAHAGEVRIHLRC